MDCTEQPQQEHDADSEKLPRNLNNSLLGRCWSVHIIHFHYFRFSFGIYVFFIKVYELHMD